MLLFYRALLWVVIDRVLAPISKLFTCYVSIVLLVLLMHPSYAQEYPLIRNFSPQEYKADNQNWSISQDEDRFIYVANNKGLMEFNGSKWTLYPSPNNTIFRSVKVIDQKVYTGFYMNFGFWERDKYGKLKYTSLTKKLKIDVLEDEQFWNILHIDHWIIFQSFQRIYVFNEKENDISFIESSNKITKIFEVDGICYFHKKDGGVYNIDQGKEVLISDDPIFKQYNVIDIYSEEEKLIVLTDKKGLFILKDGKVQPKILKGLDPAQYTFYNSLRLSSGDLALGTISEGIIILDQNGNLLYHIKQENGISNNTVLSIFEDIDHNLWIGLDNGLSLVNRNSKIKVYENKTGKLGTVYASYVFQGNLYLGSNQGLFYRKYNANQEFQMVNGTEGQVWSLNEIDGLLFCSHDAGIFVIKNTKVLYTINTQGTWNVKQLNKSNLVSGDYVGLSLLTKKNGQWDVRNKIDGFFNSSKYFEFFGKNKIFVNHEYKGIYKLQVEDDFSRVKKIERDTSVNKGLHSSIVKYRGDILYGIREGIFKYDSISNTFIRDSLLSQMFSDSTFVSGKLLYEKDRDILWSFSSKNISFATKGSFSNDLKIERVPIKKSLRKGATGYENISLLPSGKNLKGSYNGYLIFDTQSPPVEVDRAIKINTVKVIGNKGDRLLSLNDNIALDYENNNIEFEFGVAHYDVNQDTEYQYLLQGKSEEWSPWTTNTNSRFDNLGFGNYIFKVRAKIGNTVSNNEAVFEFDITRPWYYSNLMIGIYILIILLLFIGIQILNRRHYKRKNLKELEKQQQAFELQELEKEKELMLLKNQQLKTDVEGKNRELATSTMSMIKKNEFLNSIKKELLKIEDAGVSRVVKIIDRNLNNNDDWKLFEEAFNNADKDFIKKIKDLHPELTPNDLKLCAYLRLNLPSKEIAPLLNISPRSVEVKRYRLRKKMNLDHKENLTDYILSV